MTFKTTYYFLSTACEATYDAVFFGVDLPEDVALTLLQRAYASPIWYAQ